MSANASTITEFSAPGKINELTPANRSIWSREFISQWMNDEIEGNHPGRTPLTQFFNGTVQPYEVGQAGVNIVWNGFPNRIAMQFGNNDERRWKAADSSRDVQDEYLEWSIIRDNEKRIISLTFTCEGPEYWQFLGSVQRDTLVSNIYELNSPLLDRVNKRQFFSVDPNDPNNEQKWIYNPNNKFNSSTTTGTITHLVQDANTLGAEIDIAAQATVLRKSRSTGKPVTESDQLIRCSRYGDPDRNSDPRIGFKINQLALTGASVSIADPVGLYMHEFDTSNFKLDPTGDGESLQDIPEGTFTFQRGDITKQQGLRLKIQVPPGIKNDEGRQLTVSDIFDTKEEKHIAYGAQFADYITMGVHGVAITGGRPAPAEPCLRGAGVAISASFVDMVPELRQKIEDQASTFKRI